jgi:hypothetical protein
MQRPAENGEGPADLLPERTRAADNLERIPGRNEMTRMIRPSSGPASGIR